MKRTEGRTVVYHNTSRLKDGRIKIIFHEINIIFHPLGASWVFPPELSFFDRKMSEALGTHHLQATVTMLLWMWFLNVWDNVPMDLKYVCQQYFTCMCFLGFIRYNKTLIACGSGNIKMYSPTSIIFLSGVALREYSWVNTFSYFPHQHAINVYYYIRLYFTVFLLARSNTRDIPFSNILISKKQFLCNNSYMIYIIRNPILWLGISAYGGGVLSVYFSIDDVHRTTFFVM